MQIYLLRHGLAEDGKPGGRDADRALTAEGKKKLREVLRSARAAGVRPDLILTSPYRRAAQTAEVAASALGYNGEVVRSKVLQPASNPRDVWDEVRTHRDVAEILLVGHEPLFGAVAGYLLDSPSLQIDFKKGALLRIDLPSAGPHPRGVLKWMLTPKLA
jgi:phosphohistidine phosphatase